MYSQRPGFIVGFHGCDLSVRNDIVMHQRVIHPSRNEYDWLGHGFYVWENNEERALQFAREQAGRRKIKEPAVLGVYVDLGFCLDLMDSKYLGFPLRQAFDVLAESYSIKKMPLPTNKASKGSSDSIIRNLDCQVFQTLHRLREIADTRPFDTVRGVFWEGEPPYPGAGMRNKNHVQVCIRNINCIKGFFIPRIVSDNGFDWLNEA